jgi:hypothetical protein
MYCYLPHPLFDLGDPGLDLVTQVNQVFAADHRLAFAATGRNSPAGSVVDTLMRPLAFVAVSV